jgi:hypothetical protein
MVEPLPSKHETLSSNSSTTKKKKKKSHSRAGDEPRSVGLQSLCSFSYQVASLEATRLHGLGGSFWLQLCLAPCVTLQVDCTIRLQCLYLPFLSLKDVFRPKWFGGCFAAPLRTP